MPGRIIRWYRPGQHSCDIASCVHDDFDIGRIDAQMPRQSPFRSGIVSGSSSASAGVAAALLPARSRGMPAPEIAGSVLSILSHATSRLSVVNAARAKGGWANPAPAPTFTTGVGASSR